MIRNNAPPRWKSVVKPASLADERPRVFRVCSVRHARHPAVVVVADFVSLSFVVLVLALYDLALYESARPGDDYPRVYRVLSRTAATDRTDVLLRLLQDE